MLSFARSFPASTGRALKRVGRDAGSRTLTSAMRRQSRGLSISRLRATPLIYGRNRSLGLLGEQELEVVLSWALGDGTMEDLARELQSISSGFWQGPPQSPSESKDCDTSCPTFSESGPEDLLDGTGIK